MELVRPNGTITKIGWGPQPLDFSLDPLVGKAVTLQGSFSHTYATWERVLKLMATGLINLDSGDRRRLRAGRVGSSLHRHGSGPQCQIRDQN